MAYNLPVLTEEQAAMPLRLGRWYRVARGAGAKMPYFDLRLVSVDEALGSCTVRGYRRDRAFVVPISYFRSRYVLR